MALKVKCNGAECTQYPCLKSSAGGRVILFIRPKTGIELVDEYGTIGDATFSNDWIENEYVRYNGTIEISNK